MPGAGDEVTPSYCSCDGSNGAMINQRPSGWILRTSAIGLVSLGGQMSAALYNAYLPIFYGAFIASNTLIGLVMIIDNIAPRTIQPYFAVRYRIGDPARRAGRDLVRDPRTTAVPTVPGGSGASLRCRSGPPAARRADGRPEPRPHPPVSHAWSPGLGGCGQRRAEHVYQVRRPASGAGPGRRDVHPRVLCDRLHRMFGSCRNPWRSYRPAEDDPARCRRHAGHLRRRLVHSRCGALPPEPDHRLRTLGPGPHPHPTILPGPDPGEPGPHRQPALVREACTCTAQLT